MVDARRRLKLRQTDRGVARPGNARPVAVGRDPDTSGGSGGGAVRIADLSPPPGRARARHPPISRWSREASLRVLSAPRRPQRESSWSLTCWRYASPVTSTMAPTR